VTSAAVSLAIIIPTHDRRASVERTLRALSSQSYLPEWTEIIVVADGCSDGTADIATVGWAVPVRIIEQARQGPAAARNRGAAAATADILIFLDDDIEVWPGFVAAHLEAQGSDPARVVIGYLPPDLQGRRDFFAVMLRGWWEAMFDKMRDPGHRFSYSDLLSGNFSISRSLFEEVRGFDDSLQCHEDYELGFRLIEKGARFGFAERAAGWHHEHTDLMRALWRKRDEGRADVALALRHPALTPVLPLSRDAGLLTGRGRLLRTLARTRPGVGDLIENSCRSMLDLLEFARLRTRWRRLLDDLLSYWYWRGVGESIGSRTVPGLFRAPDAVLYDLDLRQGLAAAIQEIDDARPEALRLCWDSFVIGNVPTQPGAEPLRGRHLPSLLRRQFAARFADTLARAAQGDAVAVAASETSRVTDTDADALSVRGA
jgi:GT2 family glycosyltransferase